MREISEAMVPPICFEYLNRKKVLKFAIDKYCKFAMLLEVQRLSGQEVN